MDRRDFLKVSGVVAGAAFAGVPLETARADAEFRTLPAKGAFYQRRNGQLVLMARGLVESVSDDEGLSWSKPKLAMCNGEAIASDSHVLGLLRLNSGKLGLAYGRMRKVHDSMRQEILFRTSDDDGKTWSPENSVTPLPGDDLYALHGSMVQLKSGRLILPAYTSFSHDYVGRPRGVGHGWLPEWYATHMLLSDDEGQTWEPTGGMFLWKDMGHGGLVPCGEATVAETADGRVMMLARTTNMRALQSYSEDGGKTWSLVELSELCSSNAPIRLKRIPQTDDLLIVWNQCTAQEHREGYGRSRLSMALSKDSGKTWQGFRNLVLCPGMSSAPHVVDPEPPQFIRAGESTNPGQVPNNSIRGIICSSYPNVHVFNDKIYVDYNNYTAPNLWVGKGERKDVCQRLHILQLGDVYA